MFVQSRLQGGAPSSEVYASPADHPLMEIVQEPRVAATTMTASERSYNAEPLSHQHDFHQVMLPVRGQMSLQFGQASGHVGHGCLAIVAAGVDHTYQADGPNRVLIADVPRDLAEDVAAGALLTSVGPGAFLSVDARLAALGVALRTELQSGGLGDALVADALGRYLVVALRQASGQEAPAGASPFERRLARAAEEYLLAHYAQPLSVAEVAAAVGTSPSHLHRCFRAHTGASLITFVHRLRLERAATLLRETDLSVLEVTHAVGFASQSHLTRIFTRHFGCAPGQFRAGS